MNIKALALATWLSMLPATAASAWDVETLLEGINKKIFFCMGKRMANIGHYTISKKDLEFDAISLRKITGTLDAHITEKCWEDLKNSLSKKDKELLNSQDTEFAGLGIICENAGMKNIDGKWYISYYCRNTVTWQKIGKDLPIDVDPNIQKPSWD